MIEPQQAIVYYAPTKGRRYLSKYKAINAEARAIINKHFPEEFACHDDDCGCHSPGWCLETDDPKRFKRYYQMLTAALRNYWK